MAQHPQGPSPDPELTGSPQQPPSDDSSPQEWQPPHNAGGYASAGARDPHDYPGQSSFQPMAPPNYDTPAPKRAAGEPVSRTAAMVGGIAVVVIVLLLIIYAFWWR